MSGNEIGRTAQPCAPPAPPAEGTLEEKMVQLRTAIDRVETHLGQLIDSISPILSDPSLQEDANPQPMSGMCRVARDLEDPIFRINEIDHRIILSLDSVSL